MRKFWNFAAPKNEGEPRMLTIDGEIADESWFGDEVTPAEFRAELENGTGDIVVMINSPGGDVFAASQIYTMLTEYRGRVTVKVDGIAASAASVIAMAGDNVLMSRPAMLMIHNPATLAWGDKSEMEKAIGLLDEVKESIINAYEKKTGLSRAKISHMMDAETWMNAGRAIELGFADGYIERVEPDDEEETEETVAFAFERKRADNSLMEKVVAKTKASAPAPKRKTYTEILEDLANRISKFN